jgi:hypothetical protein
MAIEDTAVKVPVEEMTRDQLIEEIMWNDGGYGFGIPSFGSRMLWALDTPGPDKPDLPSIVMVCSPTDKYTDDELRLLLAFSREKTAEYDRMFRIRRGANLVIFDKPTYMNGKWMRKRLTWEFGPMHSDTLEEAIEHMRKA